MKKILNVLLMGTVFFGACSSANAETLDEILNELQYPNRVPAETPAGRDNKIRNNIDVLKKLELRTEKAITYNRALLEDSLADLADGVALGIASRVPNLRNGERRALSVGTGFYDGGSAIAVGGSLALGDTKGQVYGTLGTGLTSGKIGGGAGVQWAW